MAVLVSRTVLFGCVSIMKCVSPSRLSATRATIFAILATSSEAFDVPVYWPILVVYFFILFGITMKRQIR